MADLIAKYERIILTIYFECCGCSLRTNFTFTFIIWVLWLQTIKKILRKYLQGKFIWKRKTQTYKLQIRLGEQSLFNKFLATRFYQIYIFLKEDSLYPIFLFETLLVASFADALWSRHAVFPRHEGKTAWRAQTLLGLVTQS